MTTEKSFTCRTILGYMRDEAKASHEYANRALSAQNFVGNVASSVSSTYMTMSKDESKHYHNHLQSASVKNAQGIACMDKKWFSQAVKSIGKPRFFH